MGELFMEQNRKMKETPAVSKIRLPHLLGEGCVLQRGERTRIWGWQEGGSRIRVFFQGKEYETAVQKDGRFELFVHCTQPGGPFCLKISGEDGAETSVHEVYVGDVFVCAGQSNMELPMERVKEQFPEEFFCEDFPETARKNAEGAAVPQMPGAEASDTTAARKADTELSGGTAVQIPDGRLSGGTAAQMADTGLSNETAVQMSDAGVSDTEDAWMQAYELFTGVPRRMRGNAQVHVYKVPECASFAYEKDDHEDAFWITCSGNRLVEISAFSYFFGCFVHDAHKVPVGIINISLGGMPAQAWTSEAGLADWPELLQMKKQLEDDNYRKAVSAKQEEEAAAWERSALDKDKNAAETEWKELQVPGYFAKQGLEGYCGAVWLKRTFRAEKEDAAQGALLRLGTLNGADQTYLNGILAGETGYSYPPRRYEIPKGMLKEGENEICIRLLCGSPQGRVTPGKPYEIITASGKRIDLTGTWQYQAKGCCPPAPEWNPVTRRPCGLFQGMAAPCLPASVKGVVWYQGESNDSSPQEYEALLKALIQDWRSRWEQEKLPFIVVQLPVCGVDTAGGGAWAVLRGAQQRAAELSDVAVTVNLDLGEFYDLHPLNKKDAAYRAFLAAEHLIYGKDVVWQGPQLSGIEKQGDSLFLGFDTKDGEELCMCNGTQLQEFEVQGEDGKFIPAAAKAEGCGVRIYLGETYVRTAERVKAVRYAWRDTPMRGLICNRTGLLTGPFWEEVL